MVNSIDELRPISATSIFFKILEIVLKNRIEEQRKDGSVKKLQYTQYGFRSGLGTEP